MKRHVVTRILSLALALMLALPCVTAALAEGPSSETLLLGEGTAAETQARIDDSGVEGPAILFVAGTHGNEWAGYYAADELMAEIFPTAGKVIWVPRANIQACEIGQRTAEDEVNLNRVYPGDAGASPVEVVAADIWALIEREQPVAVVDMHEGYNFYGVDGSIGNSLVLGATDTSFINGLEILIRVNGQNGGHPDFTYDSNAPAGSLNHEVSTRLGIDTYTIETSQVLTMEERITQQKLFVRTILDIYGIPVEEVNA